MRFISILYKIFIFLTCNILFTIYSIAEIIIFAIFVNDGMNYEIFRILYMIIVYIIIFRYIDEMIDPTGSHRKLATKKMTVTHSIFTIATIIIIIFSRGSALPIIFIYWPESIIYRIKCAKIWYEHEHMYNYSYKEFQDHLDDEIDIELDEDDFDY